MSQFRTTADYVDAVLTKSGETTSGTSPYEADALFYLNKAHHAIIGGGTLFDGLEVDEPWVWAKSRRPYVIELQPAYATGTLTLTNGDEAGTLSAAPSYSLKGYYIRITDEATIYRCVSNTAASTALELDANYVGTTGAKSFAAFKLDYELVPTHLYIEASKNDKLDFIRTGSTEATATLVAGSYTPAELATHIAAVITTAAGGTSTYGCTYDSITRKFTLTSNRQGGDVFQLKCATGTNALRSVHPLLGFDDSDASNAASHESTYILGGVSRVIGPINVYRNSAASPLINSVDPFTMQNEYGLHTACAGIPSRFCIVNEESSGALELRFNKYPSTAMKIEVDVIPVPRDLKDNAVSAPAIPRKYADALEDIAAFFVLRDKEDDKFQAYAMSAGMMVKSMQKTNRAYLRRTSEFFGEIVPRRDLLESGRGRLRYGYEED